jgi:hypothetical protein
MGGGGWATDDERTADAPASIRHAILRANPSYELVLLDRLDGAAREQIAREHGDDLYGVLRPLRGDGRLQPHAVSSETALLFLTLREPAPLPGYVADRLDDEGERALVRLVLDGVLELRRDGHFVSGAAAGELLGAARSAGGRGRIGELSLVALRYGQELAALPEPLLARRLYFYGARPASPRLRRRLGDAGAFDAWLGTGGGGPAHVALRDGWREAAGQREATIAPGGVAAARTAAPDSEPAAPTQPPPAPHWRQWHARGPARGGADWKLYVSPSVDALPETIAIVADTLATARGASAFKVGGSLRGVCRPDKLVAYFDRLDDLRAGAELLRERLAGCPAHGVPFTAPITADGLLSWAADPPAAADERRSSWRMWVAQQLAQHLAAAALQAPGERTLEPWRFALERLRMTGVDTDTWVPAGGMWPTVLARG